MFCSNCGIEFQTNATFCSNCGAARQGIAKTKGKANGKASNTVPMGKAIAIIAVVMILTALLIGGGLFFIMGGTIGGDSLVGTWEMVDVFIDGVSEMHNMGEGGMWFQFSEDGAGFVIVNDGWQSHEDRLSWTRENGQITITTIDRWGRLNVEVMDYNISRRQLIMYERFPTRSGYEVGVMVFQRIR